MANCRNIQHLVYVSTAAIHDESVAAFLPTYSLTKAAGHYLMQKIAVEVDQKELQIVSFHPGSILSETSRTAGLDESSFSWDDGKSPAPHFNNFSLSPSALFTIWHHESLAVTYNPVQMIYLDISLSGQRVPKLHFYTVDLPGQLGT